MKQDLGRMSPDATFFIEYVYFIVVEPFFLTAVFEPIFFSHIYFIIVVNGSRVKCVFQYITLYLSVC